MQVCLLLSLQVFTTALLAWMNESMPFIVPVTNWQWNCLLLNLGLHWLQFWLLPNMVWEITAFAVMSCDVRKWTRDAQWRNLRPFHVMSIQVLEVGVFGRQNQCRLFGRLVTNQWKKITVQRFMCVYLLFTSPDITACNHQVLVCILEWQRHGNEATISVFQLWMGLHFARIK